MKKKNFAKESHLGVLSSSNQTNMWWNIFPNILAITYTPHIYLFKNRKCCTGVNFIIVFVVFFKKLWFVLLSTYILCLYSFVGKKMGLSTQTSLQPHLIITYTSTQQLFFCLFRSVFVQLATFKCVHLSYWELKKSLSINSSCWNLFRTQPNNMAHSFYLL